jgi:hypothetical protein
MYRFVLFQIILAVVGKPHPFWTPERYEMHEPELLKIKKKSGKDKKCAQQKDWFRHSDDDMSRWLEGLKNFLFVYSRIDIQVNGWCFATLLEDPGFCWHLLNCLEEFYKHHMHVSIIECINIMVDAFLAYESGCDEYDRNSKDESEWKHRTLCCAKPIIPWAAICMFMNDPVQYHFMLDDLGRIPFLRLKKCDRKTDRPGVFSSMNFDSLGIPTCRVSNGISVIDLLSPSGRIGYPIESLFRNNFGYIQFGEVFKNLISSNPFMLSDLFFQRAFLYLGNIPMQKFVVLETILAKKCKDVIFTEEEKTLIISKFMRAFPNSKLDVYFAGFLFQIFLRSREKSLSLKSQFCRPSKAQLPMGCNQIPFDAPAVKRIEMIGFLEVMSSKSVLFPKQSYSIMRRVLGGLLL